MPLPAEVDKDVVEFYEQWLKDGDLTPEETTALEKLISKEKNWKVLKSGVHGRRLTDKEVSAARKVQTDFEKKQKEVEDIQLQLADTSNKSKAEIARLNKELKSRNDLLTKADTTRTNMAKKLREYDEEGVNLIKEFGLDDPLITSPSGDDGGDPAPPKGKDKSTSPSFTKEDILKEVQEAFRKDFRDLAQWPVDFIKMQSEYRELFGKELPVDDFLQKVVANKGNYAETYLTEYGIAEARETKKVEAIRKEERAKLEVEYEKKRAQDLLPSSNSRPPDSAFYKAINEGASKEEKEEVRIPTGVVDRGSLLSEAISDFDKRVEKREAALGG